MLHPSLTSQSYSFSGIWIKQTTEYDGATASHTARETCNRNGNGSYVRYDLTNEGSYKYMLSVS